MGRLLNEAKKSVRTLNKIFLGAITLIIVLLLLIILISAFELAFGNIPIYSFVAISLTLKKRGMLQI